MTGSPFEGISREIAGRLSKLDVPDPALFATRPVPALKGLTLREALDLPDGYELVMIYLSRLEEFYGRVGTPPNSSG